MASSKRLFAGRLFAGRLFAPALFRGVGAEAEVATGIPARARIVPSGIGLARYIGGSYPGSAKAVTSSTIGLARALEE